MPRDHSHQLAVINMGMQPSCRSAGGIDLAEARRVPSKEQLAKFALFTNGDRFM
jgi:hypothetical protein